jgi:hypothetical protein
VEHVEPICDKGARGARRFTHLSYYRHIPKADLRAQFLPALHSNPPFLAKVQAWLA